MSFDYNKFVSGKNLLKEQGSEDLSDPQKKNPKKTSSVGETMDEYANVDPDDFTDPRGSGDPHKDMTQAQRNAMQKVNEKSHDLSRLSEDEKTQLKEYINSVREIKKEIKGLMEKAKMEERGGDVTGRTLNVESQDNKTYFVAYNSTSKKHEVKHAPKNANKTTTGSYKFKTREEAEAKAKELNSK
jgi:hypothetical protein